MEYNVPDIEAAYKMLECRHAHVYAEKTIDGKHAIIECQECGLKMKIKITMEDE